MLDTRVSGLARGRVMLLHERCARHEPQDLERGAQSGRWGRVIAVLPRGIAADVIHRHAAHHAVASRDLRRRAREGHDAVHEVGVTLRPHPAEHAAHRRSHDDSRVRDAEPLDDESVVGMDDVVVRVMRKSPAQSIAWTTRLSMSDRVAQHDVVLRGIEWLPRPEQLTGEDGREKIVSRPGRAVKDEDGVAHHAACVAPRTAQGPVVHAQDGQGLTAGELEIVNGKIARGAWQLSHRLRDQRRREQKYKCRNETEVHSRWVWRMSLLLLTSSALPD